MKLHTAMILANILLLYMGLELVSSSTPIAVQDWLTLTTQVKIGGESSSNCIITSDYGPIQQLSSGKYLLPDGEEYTRDTDEIKIGENSSTEHNLFRFVQVNGHLGYIEHHDGRIIHQVTNRNLDPPESTNIHLYGSRHEACLFSFDEENDFIVHLAGKIIQPEGGSDDPDTGTQMIIRSERLDAARFKMVPAPYPTPDLSGRWFQIFAVISPISDQSFNITYKVGKSITKQATEKVYWTTSDSIASAWFEADPDLNRYANMTEPSAWDVEEDQTYLVEVTAGQTSVIWQYLFLADRFDEQYMFRSTIIGETDDPFIPPDV